MASYAARRIFGRWCDGYALDLHTLRSFHIGDDEYGHPRFETERSELGELLYRLKNKADQSVVPEIADALAHFCSSWRTRVERIVPVPASTPRVVQPVLSLAHALSARLGVPVAESVTKRRDTDQLKNVYDLGERTRLLEGVFEVDRSTVEGKRILLFDDLYRSGATMNAITTELYESGKVSDVYALTVTRTRSNR